MTKTIYELHSDADGIPTPTGTGLGDDTLVEYDAPFNPPTVQLALYSQVQVDAYVSAAVQEERKKYEWLCEHAMAVDFDEKKARFWYDEGGVMMARTYDSVDALVTAEMRKARP